MTVDDREPSTYDCVRHSYGAVVYLTDVGLVSATGCGVYLCIFVAGVIVGILHPVNPTFVLELLIGFAALIGLSYVGRCAGDRKHKAMFWSSMGVIDIFVGPVIGSIVRR